MRLRITTDNGVPASLFFGVDFWVTFLAGLTLEAFLAGALATVFVGVFLVGISIDCLGKFYKLVLALLNLEEDCHYASQASKPHY